MTRINVVPVEELTDQHLMAEYRELPMVLASARRSKPERYKPSTAYTLNSGHVLFFFNKKKWLYERWCQLIEELRRRKYDIDPDSRWADFSLLDKFPQVEWTPDDNAVRINTERIQLRISEKPAWYKFHRQPLTIINAHEILTLPSEEQVNHEQRRSAPTD